MSISRHFLQVGTRRVHYRKAGSGPPLLMVHQSPRSSVEMEPLMRQWATYFTCIAPDTPGFGLSDPLATDAELGDFAGALIELLDALGLTKVAGYGIHSGGMILVRAAKVRPDRFSTIASCAYPVWTAEEMAIFDGGYLPEFTPSPYGEHLTWLWNRVIEQTWFFPWFDVRPEARIAIAHDDPQRTDAVVQDMLDSGDAYRVGYGAVLRAGSDVPKAHAATIPALIAAYRADPLHGHLERLGDLPPSWRARSVENPAELQELALSHLLATPTPICDPLPESTARGFVRVTGIGFDGLIHWTGNPSADTVLIHAPGRSADLFAKPEALAIDLPGHGLSDDWVAGFVPDFTDWSKVASQVIHVLGHDARRKVILGQGLSALLAASCARELQAYAWGGIDAHIPDTTDSARWLDQAIADLTPDRHGSYLNVAWNMVRASHFFWPWFDARPANAIPFAPEAVDPTALALEHRTLLRARAARPLLRALIELDRDALLATAPPCAQWEIGDWADARSDIWHPLIQSNGRPS